mmetsp:Transcript_3269/g.10900  ORF Transcript_3269/g.10900 Transcript_3269/m.10900 type:complete len:319 (+) Transcript_3269:109-1065(+)
MTKHFLIWAEPPVLLSLGAADGRTTALCSSLCGPLPSGALCRPTPPLSGVLAGSRRAVGLGVVERVVAECQAEDADPLLAEAQDVPLVHRAERDADLALHAGVRGRRPQELPRDLREQSLHHGPADGGHVEVGGGQHAQEQVHAVDYPCRVDLALALVLLSYLLIGIVHLVVALRRPQLARALCAQGAQELDDIRAELLLHSVQARAEARSHPLTDPLQRGPLLHLLRHDAPHGIEESVPGIRGVEPGRGQGQEPDLQLPRQLALRVLRLQALEAHPDLRMAGVRVQPAPEILKAEVGSRAVEHRQQQLWKDAPESLG